MAISYSLIKNTVDVRNRIIAVFGKFSPEKLEEAAMVYEHNNKPELAKIIREGYHGERPSKSKHTKRKRERKNRKSGRKHNQ